MKLTDGLKSLSFTQIVLYAAICGIGVFHEFLSCALSVILLLWLLITWYRRGSLTIHATWTAIAVSALIIGYTVTPLWALDSGDAIFGFYKFLPVWLYMLVLIQQPDGREKALNGFPYVMTVITVLSIIGMYIPAFSSFFTVADRLAGPLQYPNTFALVLLVAELLLLTRNRWRIIDFGCIAILLFGILFTGSRTVLILAIVANIIALLINRNPRIRWLALGGILLAIAAVIVYCQITDSFAILSRYLNITINSSTFVGRLLYAYDAIPVILRHPFGLGYMGYYYIQQSIQTGVYGVMFAHNDWLQIMLEVGWIPCLLLLAAIGKTVCSKSVPLPHKLILLVMVAHAAFDFDLQYVSVFMLLLLFTETQAIKTWDIPLRRGLATMATGVLTTLCLYAGTVKLLIHLGKYQAAEYLYPYSTFSHISQLTTMEDITEMNALADRMLKQNPHVTIAYSVKARHAYSLGDFGQVIEYKRKVIECAPFSTEEYVEYGYMLANGILLYQNAGDTTSAEICKRELLSLSTQLANLPQKLSYLGTKIDDQPNAALPDDLIELVETLREGVAE